MEEVKNLYIDAALEAARRIEPTYDLDTLMKETCRVVYGGESRLIKYSHGLNGMEREVYATFDEWWRITGEATGGWYSTLSSPVKKHFAHQAAIDVSERVGEKFVCPAILPRPSRDIGWTLLMIGGGDDEQWDRVAHIGDTFFIHRCVMTLSGRTYSLTDMCAIDQPSLFEIVKKARGEGKTFYWPSAHSYALRTLVKGLS